MISFQKQFLFIHIPKTGGTSVRKFLFDFSEDELVAFQDPKDNFRTTFRNGPYKFIKHSPLQHFKKILPKKKYQKLFKITTIRNPWERMISFYFSPHRNVTEWDRDQFIKLVGKIKPAEELITTPTLGEQINGFLGSSIFPKKDQPLDAEMDYIIRFEHLHEDFEEVCRLIDVPFVALPHVNKSKRKSYAQYYDEELVELVRQKFRKEIEFGNYSFGSPLLQ